MRCASSVFPLLHELPIYLTVASSVATQYGSYSFDAPVSSGAPYGNFVRCAGLSVTLRGVNFAEVSSTPTLFLSGIECWSSAWVTNTQIKCSVGSTGSSAKIALMIAGVLSTGPPVSAFSFDAPVVSFQHHSLNSAPSENLPHTVFMSVAIAGLNFEQADPTPTMVSGMQAYAASWIASTSLTMLPRMSTVALAEGLSAVWAASPCSFTVNAPVLSSLSRNNAPPVCAVSLTVVGAEFGREDLTA
jgi:hypothetical protein